MWSRHTRKRWTILAGGFAVHLVLLSVVTLFMLGIIIAPGRLFSDPVRWFKDYAEALTEPEGVTYLLGFSFVLALLQISFVVPIVSMKPPRATRRHSLKVSLVIGAMIAALLTAGCAAGLVEVLTLTMKGSPIVPEDDGWAYLLVMGSFFAAWVFWSFILLVFTRDLWADRLLGRVIGLLLAGTLLEAIVIIPIDVMVRRRTDCYCGTGTFVALCFSSTAAIFLAGPGVLILILSPRHRAWRRTYCGGCGYPKAKHAGDRCPECGFAWR